VAPHSSQLPARCSIFEATATTPTTNVNNDDENWDDNYDGPMTQSFSEENEVIWKDISQTRKKNSSYLTDYDSEEEVSDPE